MLRLRIMGVVVAATTVMVGGCGKNHAPVFDPLTDKTGVVGTELAIDIRATDADGDKLTFDFNAPAISDLKSRESPATITTFSDGFGRFRWVPTAADKSDTPYAFDFTVSDGKTKTTETIQITIKDSAGIAPIFRQPLGTGTTLDLDKDDTITVNILVEDTDSTSVTIEESDPKIDGAQFSQTSEFEAVWTWKPSADQIAARDRYTLTLNATDPDNNKATPKTYLIVLRKKADPSCPGTAPEITHLPPADAETIDDIKISATVTDDIGLKSPPLFFYATPDETSTPVQLSMTLASGTAKSGTYEGFIPNPVAAAAPGTSQTIYYYLVATDNDDPTGTACDKTTQSPVTGTFSFAVTKPMVAAPGKGVCEGPCTSDAQCGGDDDNCMQIGPSGKYFCSRICGGANPACPTGYNCSAGNLTSIDGKSSRQCMPKSGTCGASPTMCDEDNLEENDSADAIVNSTSQNITKNTDPEKAASQSYQKLAVCAVGMSLDEDWYGIPVAQTAVQTMVSVRMTPTVGADYCDIDLWMTDDNGGLIDLSDLTNEPEEISVCVPNTTKNAFVNVFSWEPQGKSSVYDLVVATTPDDSNEPNNAVDNPTNLDLGTMAAPTSVKNLTLCPGDEDWFIMIGEANTKIVIDVKFSQQRPTQDLDIYFYQDTPKNDMGVTVPTELTKSIKSTANEHIEYTVPAGDGDLYYLKVVGKPTADGKNNAGNSYEISAYATTP